MRIKRINICNYRSFDAEGCSIEIPDIKEPLAIVGYNNSGKSNFIDAIAYCLGAISSSDSTFKWNDFYLRKTDSPISIEVEVDDPLKSSDAYNQIKAMPVFQLKIENSEGVIHKTHMFCDGDSKPIYNPRALKRGKKEYTEDEKEILNDALKQGTEPVWRWKSKIPVYKIDCSNIAYQLKPTGYTLLGKVMDEVKKDFESSSNVMPDKAGVGESHKGKPRVEIFNKLMNYLEAHILSTPNLESLIKTIEEVIQKQLQLEKDAMTLRFGFVSPDDFFSNLTFYLSDNAEKPQLPVDHMGSGFISLFVVALIRAISQTDEGGNIYLIEEPETFLHEHFQEYFYTVLRELAQNNQVIYTTHSKKFVNLFEPKSLIRVKNKDYLKSEIIYPKDASVEYPDKVGDFQISEPADFAKFMRSLEPNIGNIVFANKVILVEGPDDVIGYKTVLSTKYNLGLESVAVVAAWGKDTLTTLIQLCKLYEIDFFVIHDWDIASNPALQEPNSTNGIYQSLTPAEKAQYTKNYKILSLAGSENVHANKIHLEAVLGISSADKGAMSVFSKVAGKSIDQIQQEFPSFLPTQLLSFMDS